MISINQPMPGREGNPATADNVVPDTVLRSNFPNHVSANGMGTEGQAIGVITSLDVMGESLPPNFRTVQEPPGEWLK